MWIDFDEEIMQKIKVYRNLLSSAQSTFKYSINYLFKKIMVYKLINLMCKSNLILSMPYS